MKSSWFVAVPLFVLAVVGCEGPQAQAEAKLNEVTAQAQSAVDNKLQEAKDLAAQKAGVAAQEAQTRIMNQVDPDGTLREGKAKIQEGQQMLEKVKQGQVMDPEVQTWIQTHLASTNQAVQAIAIPVMNQAYAQFPEKREMLKTQAQDTLKKSEGAVREAWQQVIDSWVRLESVSAAQR